MTDRRHREDYKLLPSEWPPADTAAWHRATNPRPGPFNPQPVRSPFTYRRHANGWGVYLYFLKTRGELDPAEAPSQRVTLARLDSFFAMLKQRGNADYTILARFEELRGALQLMCPGEDFRFITRPQNISIRQMLPMQRKQRFVPDARHAVLWAQALFDDALVLADPAQRRLQVRDAAIIGIFASRGPRLRAVAGMRLGKHLVHAHGAWELYFDRSLMKGGQRELRLPNDPRVNAILDRYVRVERQELLGSQAHDHVWVSLQGSPLSYKGIETMFRQRAEQQFGISFGPHRLRASLVTTAAVVDGTDALGPAAILGHSPQTALKSYNRATSLAATRRHDDCISRMEDAVRIFGRRAVG